MNESIDEYKEMFNDTSEVLRKMEEITGEDVFAVHEEVFKSGKAMLVDETPEEYRDRVEELWQKRKQEIIREQEGKIFSDSSKVSDSVRKWLGHPKSEEYARRYKAGESIDDILKDQNNIEDKKRAIEILADTLVDARQEGGVRELRTDAFEQTDEVEVAEEEGDKNINDSILEGKDYSQLSGWAASYELARVATEEGVNLVALSREEYAGYAVDHNLAIDDDQLRAAPWERMETSPEDIITRRKEIEVSIPEEVRNGFDTFAAEIITKAGTGNRKVREGVAVRSGTNTSNSWLFFKINSGLEGGAEETYKSYLTFNDLSTFTSERFVSFMEALRDAGYEGDVKTFQDMSMQGVLLNDQVVMHGASERDAQLALEVAEQFFGGELLGTGVGKDEVLEGENKSYSQILSNEIRERIKNKLTKK